MIRDSRNRSQKREDPAILLVLEDVVRRRLQGDDLPDETVIAAHPNLMPLLREKLASLRATESARQLAVGGAVPVYDSSIPSAKEPWMPESLSGHSLAGYELQEVLGRGAMGVVYRAVQTGTRREVAVKVMLQRPFVGASDQARFEREAQVLGHLRHPHIVTVYDTGWSRGQFFLVMDYVAGTPLDTAMRTRSLSLRAKLLLFAQVSDAVHAAHLRGIIHRDIKPSNILVDADGNPHLVDFGLAKVLDGGGEDDMPEAYAHSMTLNGQFVGSLPWASPEQAGYTPDRIDIRSDVYSLGVTLFQLLTGKFPYSIVGNIRDVVDRILASEPMRPRLIDATIPDEVETIVLMCLSKERQRRYQSAGELAQDLRRYLAGEPIEAKRNSAWYMLRKALHRQRFAALVISGVMGLTIVYAATMSVFYRDAQAEAQRAQRTLEFLQDTLFQASAQRLGSGATLKEVLDSAAQRVEHEFAGQPAISAALHFTLGSAYESIWQNEKAVSHLRQAVATHRDLLGADHPATLKSQLQLGRLLAEESDSQGIKLIQEAYEIRQRIHGDDDYWTADAERALAYSLWAASRPARYDEAHRHYQHALEVIRREMGPEHPDVIRIETENGSMSRSQGNWDEAEKFYRAGWSMANRILGPSHQYTIESRIALSDLYVDMRRYAEAMEILHDVQPLADRLFGPQALPQILRRKAYILLAQNDFAASESTFISVQTAACDRIAATHHDQAPRFRALATALDGSSVAQPLDELYLQAVDAVQEVDPMPIEAARSLVGMGRLRFRQQRFAEAAAFLRRSMDYLQRQPESQLPLQVGVTQLLTSSLRSLDLLDEAESILRDTHQMLIAMVGPDDDLSRQVLMELVRLLKQAGRNAEARELRDQYPIPQSK